MSKFEEITPETYEKMNKEFEEEGHPLQQQIRLKTQYQ